MNRQHLDGFGRMATDPGRLTRAERIELLCQLAGRLQAQDARDVRWLGRVLGQWLRDGGCLEVALGVRAPRGSHARPEALSRRAEVDSGLVTLARAVGAARACRVLKGEETAPVAHAVLVERLRCLRAPISEAAITRARRRSRDRR